MNPFVNNPLYDNEELKSVYDKHSKRQFGIPMPLHLFGSSSKGNALYVKPLNLMIDLGFPYKRYIEYDPHFFLNLKTLIITHQHSDHLNVPALIKIAKTYPHIQIFLTESTYDAITDPHFRAKYKRQRKADGSPAYEQKETASGWADNKQKPLYEHDKNGNRIIEKSPYLDRLKAIRDRLTLIKTPTYSLTLTNLEQERYHLKPHTVKHGDIVNIAIDIEYQKYRMLYVSDLDSLGKDHQLNDEQLDGLPQEENLYDLCFVEANYDIAIIQQTLDQADKDDYATQARVRSSLRHLSEQEAKAYINWVLKDTGYFIPLHASQTFGTLQQ